MPSRSIWVLKSGPVSMHTLETPHSPTATEVRNLRSRGSDDVQTSTVAANDGHPLRRSRSQEHQSRQSLHLCAVHGTKVSLPLIQTLPISLWTWNASSFRPSKRPFASTSTKISTAPSPRSGLDKRSFVTSFAQVELQAPSPRPSRRTTRTSATPSTAKRRKDATSANRASTRCSSTNTT